MTKKLSKPPSAKSTLHHKATGAKSEPTSWFGERQAAIAAASNMEFLQTLFENADDRTVIIRASSLLEKILEMSIAGKFHRVPSNTAFNELFTGEGVLATFSAKIALAFQFDAIPEKTKHDCLIIKAIRNECAHSFDHITFETESIARRCDSLKMGKYPLEVERAFGDATFFSGKPRKLKFVRSFTRILATFGEHLAMRVAELKVLNENKQLIRKAGTQKTRSIRESERALLELSKDSGRPSSGPKHGQKNLN